MNIYDDVSLLKGVGPKTKEQLNNCGIYKMIDLLLYFPKGYESIQYCSDIGSLNIDKKNIIINCTYKRSLLNHRSKTGKMISTLIFNDGVSDFKCIWFNQPYITNNFKVGCSYLLSGVIEIYNKEKLLINPKVNNNSSRFKDNAKKIIIPKYNLSCNLTNSTFIKLISQILNCIEIKETFPKHIIEKYNLCSLNFAIKNIHEPIKENELVKATFRLKFQELFSYSLKIFLLKKLNNTKKGIEFTVSPELKLLKEHLPFKLTYAQSRVIREIINDEKSVKPMNRLLQGDVGSGKTIVAFIGMFNVVKNSYQAAMIAPTEILATQHFNECKKLFNDFDIKIEILTGSISEKKKSDIKNRLKEGTIDIIIGTHALFENNVEFNNLGLVVTDELHRFGVMQRSKLFNKGGNIDILVMTATPIPRTLSLYMYGDLDVSIIDELPPNRKQIKTYCIDKSSRDRVYNFAKKTVNQGNQVYIVCPLVEDNDAMNLISVEFLYEDLKNRFFKDIPTKIMHGKMNNKEKNGTMEEFKNGTVKILISTTVIEVGVNIPNATLMIIEDAERFGLAQLHQLRGRVGRGSDESYCVLIADIKKENIKKRMNIIKNSTDGFNIAEEDLKLRGSGELFGYRQHGENGLILSDIFEDIDKFKKANEEAKEILQSNSKEDKEFVEELMKKMEQDTKFICFN